MQFTELSEFLTEFKKLHKRFPSLSDDLEKFKKVVLVFPRGNGSKHWDILHTSETILILKARLSCTYLKKSSLRIIYSYFPDDGRCEFIELYFKGDKERENTDRIKNYLKSLH